jgi:hypothetical protein
MAKKPFDALEIVQSLESESVEDMKRVGLAILQSVVVSTPVGNPTLWQQPFAPPGYVGGHARRNWHVSTQKFVDNITGKAGKGGGAGAATSQSVDRGTRNIDRFKLQSGRLIIQNNVPYIVPLNNGHSTQAPRNFVQQAVMVGVNAGRNEKKDLP